MEKVGDRARLRQRQVGLAVFAVLLVATALSLASAVTGVGPFGPGFGGTPGAPSTTFCNWGTPGLYLYEEPDFQGLCVFVGSYRLDLGAAGLAGRASSARVTGDRPYLLYSDLGLRGDQITLRPGDYPDLGALGWDNRAMSAIRQGDLVPTPSTR